VKKNKKCFFLYLKKGLRNITAIIAEIIAFPIAAAMLRKGARLMNIVVFLGIWVAAKLPQLMVEIKFLGPAFTALHLVLTMGSVIAIGFLVEYFMHEKKYGEIPVNTAPESMS